MKVLYGLKSCDENQKQEIRDAFDKIHPFVDHQKMANASDPDNFINDTTFFIIDEPFANGKVMYTANVLTKPPSSTRATLIYSPLLKEESLSPNIHIFHTIEEIVQWILAQEVYIPSENKQQYHDNGHSQNSEDSNNNILKDLHDYIVHPAEPIEEENDDEKEEDEVEAKEEKPSADQNGSDKDNESDIENEYSIEDIHEDKEQPIKNMSNDMLVGEDRISDMKKKVGTPATDRNKTIGFWSPIHKVGVTTLSESLSLYFAKNGVQVALIEGITDQPRHITNLKKYSSKPTNWISFASGIFDPSVSSSRLKWFYQDIHWFPCDYKDSHYGWTTETIQTYISGLKHYDLTFIDFPTGPMSPITRESIGHVDELWIVVNNYIDELSLWIDYIQHTLRSEMNIPIYFIYNAVGTRTPFQKWKKEDNITTLVDLADQSSEINYYRFDKNPVYLSSEYVARSWETSFEKLKQHLSVSFPKQESQEKKKPSKITQLFRSFI